jgi:single-strand DNA-binding protein
MANGDAVANLSLATSESWKDKNGQQQEKTEWHKLTMYRRLGEIAGEYLKKGSMIYVEGKLQTRKWQDQQGNDKHTTEVICDKMQMLGGKQDSAQPSQQAYQHTPNPSHLNADGSPKTPAQMAGKQEPVFDIDDDMPF